MRVLFFVLWGALIGGIMMVGQYLFPNANRQGFATDLAMCTGQFMVFVLAGYFATRAHHRAGRMTWLRTIASPWPLALVSFLSFVITFSCLAGWLSGELELGWVLLYVAVGLPVVLLAASLGGLWARSSILYRYRQAG